MTCLTTSEPPRSRKQTPGGECPWKITSEKFGEANHRQISYIFKRSSRAYRLGRVEQLSSSIPVRTCERSEERGKRRHRVWQPPPKQNRLFHPPPKQQRSIWCLKSDAWRTPKKLVELGKDSRESCDFLKNVPIIKSSFKKGLNSLPTLSNWRISFNLAIHDNSTSRAKARSHSVTPWQTSTIRWINTVK